MRPLLLSLVSLALVGLSAPAQAQTCAKAPLPSLPSVFPDVVEGLGRQFYNRMEGCYTNLYRPEGATGDEPWAVVSAEPNEDPFLGESAEGLEAHYRRSGTEFLTVGGWPVAFTVAEVGDEFIALRGSVRLSIIVKNGDHGARSKSLAEAFLSDMLPRVPCG